jgi:hypothetical protein
LILLQFGTFQAAPKQGGVRSGILEYSLRCDWPWLSSALGTAVYQITAVSAAIVNAPGSHQILRR